MYLDSMQALQKCMQIPMDKICKHQQLFDSRDAVVPLARRRHTYHERVRMRIKHTKAWYSNE